MAQSPNKSNPPLALKGVQLVFVMIVAAAFLWQLVLITRGQPQDTATPASVDTALVRIDINEAEMRELALLPDVGPVLARKIVDDREQHGRFETLGELERIKGIGPKTIDRFDEICFVGP